MEFDSERRLQGNVLHEIPARKEMIYIRDQGSNSLYGSHDWLSCLTNGSGTFRKWPHTGTLDCYSCLVF